MTDDIKKLIAQAREIGNRGYTTDLIHSLVGALEAKQREAEHGWSLVYIERANVRIEYERRTAVEAERDALRTVIQSLIADLDDARAHGEIFTYGMVQDRLSRAIDTKELQIEEAS